MVQQLPSNLRKALDSDCAEDLSELIRRPRRADIDALQRLVSLDASILPEHRAKALYALGRLGDSASVPAIRNILPNLDEQGRISAIDALGRIGTDQALSGIVEHVDDDSRQVRLIVTRALSRFNTSEAQNALRRMAANDPDDAVRDAAARRT